MSLVRIWVYDGILASSVAGASDVFTAANAISAEHLGRGRDKARLLKWRIESLDGRDVQSASNQMIKVDGPINSRAAADVVIVPGPFVRDIERFLKKTDLVAPLLTALRRQHEHGELSSCRGRIAGRRRRHDSLGQGQGFC
jgi:transcriptional regulator GlxA family with amidase domain